MYQALSAFQYCKQQTNTGQGPYNEADTKVRGAKYLACSVVTGDNVGKFVLRHAQVTNLGGGLTSELPGYPSRQHVLRNRYEFL